MHYIIGTSFSVKADPRRGFRSLENSFSVNTLYKITNITVLDNNLNYTFTGTDHTQVKLSFISSKEADSFIARLRNEQIPDYTSEIGKIDV
jgi:hypothetical protein